MTSTSIFPFKYFYTRVYPFRYDDKSEFSGVMENEINKINVHDLESFINLELAIQEKIFKRMGCNEELIKTTLEHMRLTYNSSK